MATLVIRPLPLERGQPSIYRAALERRIVKCNLESYFALGVQIEVLNFLDFMYAIRYAIAITNFFA